MLVNIVSPPTGGMVMPRSSEPSDGTGVNDMSECQRWPVYLEADGLPSASGMLVTSSSSG